MYKISSTLLFMYCCTSSALNFCLTWHLTNMMLRSVIYIVQCHTKTENIWWQRIYAYFNRWEYVWFNYLNLIGLIIWIDWEITISVLSIVFKPTGRKTLTVPKIIIFIGLINWAYNVKGFESWCLEHWPFVRTTWRYQPSWWNPIIL